MRRIDVAIGAFLALLGLAVGWSARGFPAVPGQKLGAGFLPMIVAAGLVVCALALMLRSARGRGYLPAADESVARPRERSGSALVIVGVLVAYVLAADRIGFLIVAPFGLLAVFRAFGVGWRAAIVWAIVGTAVVHLAFYKLLRVPLPWGVLRPFY